MPVGHASQLADDFARMASSIKEGQPDAIMATLLEDVRSLCESAAPASSEVFQSLLTNLRTVVTTWRDVWPRLGDQPEFRSAVAREAELWSRRLRAMAQGTTQSS